jgi:hypothetical protein
LPTPWEHPGTTDPLLLDPQMLGSLYLGTLRIDSDPYSGFTRNVTDVRFECNTLMHVRDIRAARRIGAA